MRSHLAWLGEKARAMRAADAQLFGAAIAEVETIRHQAVAEAQREASRLVEAAEAEERAMAVRLAQVGEANRRMAAEVAEAKSELARAQAARQAEVAELRDDLERVRTRLNTVERRLATCGELLRDVCVNRDGYTVCPVCLLAWPSHRPACVIGKLEDALDQRASSFAASFERRKTEAG